MYEGFFITLLNYPLFYRLMKAHIYFLPKKRTSIIQHQHSFFKILRYTFINKNRDIGTHSSVAVYIKDGIPFTKRTDLEINELQCIWLE